VRRTMRLGTDMPCWADMPRRFVLACIPFAGAGASFYRPWQRLTHEAFDVLPLQLPGHEERIGEPLIRDVHEAAQDLVGQLGDLDGKSLLLFGHSLGADLAYEMALSLASSGAARVARLYVSGAPGPSTPRRGRATGLDDIAFLGMVNELAGYKHEALEIPELREMLLPVIRADVEMHEIYRPSTTLPLNIPVTAVRGRDDHLVCGADAMEWRRATSAKFEMLELDGGHMYLVDGPEPLLDMITSHIRTLTASCGHSTVTTERG
jgi:surfactin synthase thioesterase subunit